MQKSRGLSRRTKISTKMSDSNGVPPGIDPEKLAEEMVDPRPDLGLYQREKTWMKDDLLYGNKKLKKSTREKEHVKMDQKSRKQFEAIQRLSAKTRHRTGIFNAKERNRLQLHVKRMDKTMENIEVKVSRMRRQLKKELHEMEAERRAMKYHPISLNEQVDKQFDKKTLETYAARGRYIYSMRHEKKRQSEAMVSYNPRKEHATRMLGVARRDSVIALDKGLGLVEPSQAGSYQKPPKTPGKYPAYGLVLPPIQVLGKSNVAAKKSNGVDLSVIAE